MRLQLIATLLLTIFLSKLVECSYCGQAAIPFSLQILSNGQPVLGCAKPSCFGWPDDDNLITNKPYFYKIHHKNDGFVRKSDLNKYRKIAKSKSAAQLATCEKNYESTKCSGNKQWVGGISPTSNFLTKPLMLRCCTYPPLANSWDHGTADIRPGEIVVGSEVSHYGRQYAFEYIANVWRQNMPDGSVVFGAAMRRFQCMPFLANNNVQSNNITRNNITRKYFIEQLSGTSENLAKNQQDQDNELERKRNGYTNWADPPNDQSSVFRMPTINESMEGLLKIFGLKSSTYNLTPAPPPSADPLHLMPLLNSLPFGLVNNTSKPAIVEPRSNIDTSPDIVVPQHQQQQQQQQQQYPKLASMNQMLGLQELPTLPLLPNIFG